VLLLLLSIAPLLLVVLGELLPLLLLLLVLRPVLLVLLRGVPAPCC
jgi:hypothetical protein